MRQFNDTTNLDGLVQMYELEIGAEPGFVSGSTTRLKQFAAATRSAWDRYVELAMKASGKWQFDDSNHQDASGNYTFPAIKTHAVQGQRDYSFTTDESGAFVLDVHKVLILPSATATEYIEVYPIDQQTKDEAADITSERTAQGVPTHYDKSGNTITFNVPFSYTTTDDTFRGVKVLINRTASYFTYSDTTKRPGCPAIHHDYFYLKPALDAARRNDKSNYLKLREEVVSFEGDEEKRITGSIERYFSRRSRDEKPRITPRLTPYI